MGFRGISALIGVKGPIAATITGRESGPITVLLFVLGVTPLDVL